VEATNAVRNVTYQDTSALDGVFSGTVVIDAPVNQSGLTGYNVYLAVYNAVNGSGEDTNFTRITILPRVRACLFLSCAGPSDVHKLLLTPLHCNCQLFSCFG
jgi:hypothetical protein